MRLITWVFMVGILAGCTVNTDVMPSTSVSVANRPTVPVTTSGWASLMTWAHNRVRARLKLPALSWSPQLAHYAQAWATHLATQRGCRMIHRSEARADTRQYGENLYWASALLWSDGQREVQAIRADRVANAWASEAQFYNYRTNRCQRGEQCGHYTQMIWRTTLQVGCGMAVCPDSGQIWVCNYNPTGNWIGERPY